MSEALRLRLHRTQLFLLSQQNDFSRSLPAQSLRQYALDDSTCTYSMFQSADTNVRLVAKAYYMKQSVHGGTVLVRSRAQANL